MPYNKTLFFVIQRVDYGITAKYTWKNVSECDSVTVELMLNTFTRMIYCIFSDIPILNLLNQEAEWHEMIWYYPFGAIAFLILCFFRQLSTLYQVKQQCYQQDQTELLGSPRLRGTTEAPTSYSTNAKPPITISSLSSPAPTLASEGARAKTLIGSS